jgi:hypothetical protein|nr:MAG TPA: ATPase [Caudoviricetes sp.]
MQNVYQVAQGIVKFGKDIDPNLFKKNLPAGFYTTAISQGQIFLNQANPLTIPSKIYGDSTDRMNRIITSFKATDKNLGVLLYGESGSGKSLLAKQVCVELSKEHPVIIVLPEHIDIIDKYIESIDDRCVFFIDEFEKMFEKPSEQSCLLSVVDGTSSKKNLFLFTANDKAMVNKFFFNRPGRIRYAYEYETLPDSIVLEVLKDILDNKERVQEIASVISYLKEPSFDVVCSIAQEANLYPHFTVQQLMDGYNSEIYSNGLDNSDCMLFINGQDFYSVLKDLFSKYDINLQYCIPSGITDDSAIQLKEISLKPGAPKVSLNLMDFSLRACRNGMYQGTYVYMYFDISEIELEVQGRCSTIHNIRAADSEINDMTESIFSLMMRSNKEIPESAREEVLKLLSSNDIKLVSKPIKMTKFKTFNAF